MDTIGDVGRPDIREYANRKKVYFVRNLHLPKNAAERYKNIFNQYWDEVDEHLAKVEAAGKVSKIFCESIYMTGEESMKVIHAMNIRLEQIIRKKIEAGGKLLPLEDKEIFGAYIDWSHCLSHVRTHRVHETIHRLLKETVKERFDHIRAVFQENLADGEAALLIMREEDRELLNLPEDIELFYITPPAYDDLLKFFRDSKAETEFWRKV